MARFVRGVIVVVAVCAALAACGDKKTTVQGANGADLPNNGFPLAASDVSGGSVGAARPFPSNTAFQFCIQIEPHGTSSDLKPALTLGNPVAGTYTGTFGTGPSGPVAGTGQETGPSNVIVFTFPITRFGVYDDLTLKAPDGTPIDLGSITTGLPLDINAETDKPNGCDPAKLQVPPATATDTASSATPVETDHDAVVRFLPLFEHAVQVDDVAFLVAALDPAVTQRYGADQCSAAFASTGPDPTAKLTFKSFTSGPEPYSYTTDGKTDVVDNTYDVAIARTADGKSSDGEIHLSVHAGKVGWFTRCTA